MFASLKNKLLEEVKASPSKFQQFANAAQAAVSSSTSTTPNSSDTSTTNTSGNENFFSITEEDTPQNSPYRPLKLPAGASTRSRGSTQSLNNGNSGGGTLPRTRKLSNSSMASDASFRLPSYEAPAVYHLQSDFEASESEFGDDTASTARLNVITKEQLYAAYQKSLENYQKYRGRYTDLAKKYKELEHDGTKARSALVETQEKAIRRINELREQCTLEQQAKAHLEEALRMEMDDMNCKMQSYQTKLKLLGENPDNVSMHSQISNETNATLIDLEEHPPMNGVVDTKEVIQLQANVANLQKELSSRDAQLSEMIAKHDEAKSTIEKLRKQEEENTLFLAQTKQAIHTELVDKENEVKQLNDKLKKLENDLKTANKSATQLESTKEQLKKLQNAKFEADAKVIATEHMLKQLKADLTANEQKLTEFEQKQANSNAESERSLQELRQQNVELNEMLEQYKQHEVSLAEVDNALNRSKSDNDTLKLELAKSEQRVRELQASLQQAEESAKGKEQEAVNEIQERAFEELKDKLEQKEKEVKTSNNKVNKLKKQLEQQQSSMSAQQVELNRLETELAAHKQKLEKIAQLENEKCELQERVSAILQEISDIQEHMVKVQQSHSVLEEEKRSLEHNFELLLKKQTEADDSFEKIETLKQEHLSEIEDVCLKLQATEVEHAKLQEKMKQVLDENSRMHNAQEIADHDYRTLQDKYDALTKEKEVAVDALASARMELESSVKEKTALETELQELKVKCNESASTLSQYEEQCEQLQQQLSALKLAHSQNEEHHKLLEQAQQRNLKLQDELSQITSQLQSFEHQTEALERNNEELVLLRGQRDEMEQQLLEEIEHRKALAGQLKKQEEESRVAVEKLQAQFNESVEGNVKKEDYKNLEIEVYSLRNENLKLTEAVENWKIVERDMLAGLASMKSEHEAQLLALEQKCSIANADVERLHEANDQLQLEMEKLLSKQEEARGQMQVKMVEYEQLQIEVEYLRKQMKILEVQLVQANEKPQDNELKEKLKSLQCELYVFKDNADRHAKELTEQRSVVDAAKAEAAELKSQLDKQAEEMRREAEHVKFITQSNDDVQKELFQSQAELKRVNEELNRLKDNEISLEKQLEIVRAENELYIGTIETLTVEHDQQRTQIKEFEQEKEKEQLKSAKNAALQHRATSPIFSDPEHLRVINEQLQRELEELKHRSSTENATLQQEMEDLQSMNKQMIERIAELERLKDEAPSEDTAASLNDEKAAMEGKLKEIMSDVQDVNTRNIFLEQRCENFTILEQSNERLKLQNEKLSRQLDETLVSMQHSESISANTEFEYLKNIMFQYLTGSTNNETLVKVISAVLKFSPQQTEVALEKEHQRRSLLNKIL